MARQTVTRKPGVNRSSAPQNSQTPGIAVLQNQRVFGARAGSTQGVEKFLGGIGDLIIDKHVTGLKTDAADDAMSGEEIDPEQEGNHVYRGTFNSIRGETDALQAAADVETDLAQAHQVALENNEPFDPTEFVNSKFESLEASKNYADVPEYRDSILKAKAQLLPSVVQASARISAKHELVEQENEIIERADVRFNTGNFTPTDIDEVERLGSEMGFPHKQTRELVLDQVGRRMEKGKTLEDVDRVFDTTKAYYQAKDKGAWLRREDDLEELRDQAKNAVSARTLKAATERAGEVDDFYFDQTLDIGKNPDDWDQTRIRQMADAGQLGVTPAENRRRALDLRKRLADSREDQLKEQTAKTEQESRIEDYEKIPDDPRIYAAMTAAEKTQYEREFLQPRSNALMGALRDLGRQASSGTPEEQQNALNGLWDATEQMESLFAHQRATGQALPVIGDTLAMAADTLDEGQLSAVAPVYAMLKRRYGSAAMHGLSSEQQTNLDRYFSMTFEDGMEPAVAAERLQNKDREAISRHTSHLENDPKAAKKLHESLGEIMNPTDPDAWWGSNQMSAANGDTVADELRADVAYALSTGKPLEQAITDATANFKEHNVFFDGHWLPNEGLPDETMARFEVAKKATIAHLQETTGLDMGDPDDIRLAPIPGGGKFGDFMVIRPEGGLSGFVTYPDGHEKEGEIMTVNAHDEARLRFDAGVSMYRQDMIENPGFSANAMALLGQVAGPVDNAAEYITEDVAEGIAASGRAYKERLIAKQEAAGRMTREGSFADHAGQFISESASKVPSIYRRFGEELEDIWMFVGESAETGIKSTGKAAHRFFTQAAQREAYLERNPPNDDDKE